MDVLWFLNFATWDQVKQLLNYRCLHNPTLLCGFYLITVFKMLNSKPAVLSPALWWWSLKLSVPFSANAELSARPKVLSCQRDNGSRGTVPNPWQGTGVCTGALLRSLGAASRALAVHKQLKLLTKEESSELEMGEGTCSGCFCARSCWYQNSPMFPRLISKPTCVLSYCEPHSSESSTWHRCNALSLLGLSKKTCI